MPQDREGLESLRAEGRRSDWQFLFGSHSQHQLQHLLVIGRAGGPLMAREEALVELADAPEDIRMLTVCYMLLRTFEPASPLTKQRALSVAKRMVAGTKLDGPLIGDFRILEALSLEERLPP